MTMVIRADGTTEPFMRSRIVDALVKETKLCAGLFGTDGISIREAERYANQVACLVNRMRLAHITSHTIRELTCTILFEDGKLDWYRVTTRVGMSSYDGWKIDNGDGFEARDNANLKGNAETAHKKKADKLSKEQNLMLLPPHLSILHNVGDLHIHDLEYFGTRPFCADSDLRYLFYYGLLPSGDATTSAVAKPAKNAEVAILHAVKWLGSAQTNFAGGQGFYNFLTFLAPYLEGKPYNEIKQLMQMFVYEMMQMYCARGGQVVFSSVQLSPGVPRIWRQRDAVFKGKVWRCRKYRDGATGVFVGDPGKQYGMFEREVRLAFKALMEVMLDGDAQGKPFAFPKPEIALEPCFVDGDAYVRMFDVMHPELPTYRELYSLAFELAAKFGTPYFDNMLPAYRGAGEGISCYQCCAYTFSTDKSTDSNFEHKMDFVDGAHFSMGSWLVVSLNCPRAAYKAKLATAAGVHGPPEDPLYHLKELMHRAVEIFQVKRSWMNRLIQSNRIPFATQTPADPSDEKTCGPAAIDLDSYVYTIGVVGIDDMVAAYTGKRMYEDRKSLEYGLKAIICMKQYAQELSKRYGIKIALARTPAETTAQRFAVCDLRAYDYMMAGARSVVQGDVEYALKHLDDSDLPVYYTNGTHVPPAAPVDLIQRLVIESKFFPILDGGNIAHIWLGEAYTNPDGLMDFAMNLAKSTDVGYFAFTKDFTVCRECQAISAGIHRDCERCGSDSVDHMSRITGYLSNVSGWNEGKRRELLDRIRVQLDPVDGKLQDGK